MNEAKRDMHIEKSVQLVVETDMKFFQAAQSVKADLHAGSFRPSMLFTEIMGPTLGNLVNVLVLLHGIAVAYWIWGTLKEAQTVQRVGFKGIKEQ
eukprot:g55997.t1